jgi:hypothetical protein
MRIYFYNVNVIITILFISGQAEKIGAAPGAIGKYRIPSLDETHNQLRWVLHYPIPERCREIRRAHFQPHSSNI